jgi:translation initiation factor IF-2
MAKKQLIQVVRELSVGMDTIHDFLISKGFELEKKPNAKLSEDMYDALMIEYQNDLAIKNKAEQMSLSNKPSVKKEEKLKHIHPHHMLTSRKIINPKFLKKWYSRKNQNLMLNLLRNKRMVKLS